MLAVAVVELLPEAFARSGRAAPALVLAGYLAVHFTQHTLTPHFHFGEETHAVNRVAGPSALVGVLVDTLFCCVGVASGVFLRPAPRGVGVNPPLPPKTPGGLALAR